MSDLCQDCPLSFQKFLIYVRNLRFEENPDYNYLKKLLEDVRTTEKILDNYLEWVHKSDTKKASRLRRKKSLTFKPEIELKFNKVEDEPVIKLIDANGKTKEILRRKKTKRRSHTLIPIKINNGSDGEEGSKTFSKGFRVSTPRLSLTHESMSPTNIHIIISEGSQNPLIYSSDQSNDQTTPKSKMPEMKNREILRKARTLDETEHESEHIVKSEQKECCLF